MQLEQGGRSDFPSVRTELLIDHIPFLVALFVVLFKCCCKLCWNITVDFSKTLFCDLVLTMHLSLMGLFSDCEEQICSDSHACA